MDKLIGVIPTSSKPPEIPDRIWTTYSALVWCCNSLNAEEGKKRRQGDKWNATLLHRAQDVIRALLDETGRTEEFEQWEKEHMLSELSKALVSSFLNIRK